uniref:Uncharacterized protein LOC104249521 n=1 Tax=Nicotiana sylvestris TaxID=4096 RepID=A0A1U7YMB6_NICSY
MVRMRATGRGGLPPIPPAEATRGRKHSRGHGKGRAARATPIDPAVAPAQDQAPAAPVQMVRMRATGRGGLPPIPPAEATRGRRHSRGHGRGRAARATPIDPAAAPAQDQAPAAPVQ